MEQPADLELPAARTRQCIPRGGDCPTMIEPVQSCAGLNGLVLLSDAILQGRD